MSSNKQGPESREYDKLKGTVVVIWPMGSLEAWTGKLIWVDRYTIGVAFDWQNDPQCVSIVYKDGIRIDPARDSR